MCAIVDTNASHEVFGNSRSEAGEQFFKWIEQGRGRLVVGGRLLDELNRTSAGEWARQAIIAGRIQRVNDTEIDARVHEINRQERYRSDDPHVLALAQISGARLLFSNDNALIQDFKDRRIISTPRGRIYSTNEREGRFHRSHKKLLRRNDLCRRPKQQ